jgi:hypothetical protein
MSQVELNEHVLAELELLQNNAQNPAVHEYVTTIMPAMRDALSRARAIAVKRGFERKRA